MTRGARLKRRLEGALELSAALARRPSLARDLRRWIGQADNRHDPLAARQPWWNFRAVSFVEECLPPGARVFEYGGGASTLWLLDKGCDVRTVEHDEGWFRALTARTGAGVVELAEPDAGFSAYVNAINDVPDGSLDLVIVDGRERVRCGLAAMPKIKPGGMLLLDDSERSRYQPLHDALHGWSAVHLQGLKAGDWAPHQTSLWTKQSAHE
jgi:hypothetical protein